MGTALKADVTVTFGWEKAGTALYPGRSYGGRGDCGGHRFLPQAPELANEKEEAGEERGRENRYIFTCEEEDLGRIPDRPAYSNKGTFGKVLIAAGSKTCAEPPT